MLFTDARTQLKIEIIHKIEMKKMNVKEARLILGVSERTLRRYLQKYRERGLISLQHGNKGRAPRNRSPVARKLQVQQLVKDLYYDLNMLHCIEKLRTEHGIHVKRETFRKWCHEINCVKRAKRKRVRARKRRDRMEKSGLLIQMDGSTHRWFGDQKSCLIATIDDATNEIPYAEFFETESTLSCLKVLKNLIEAKGVFSVLYVDRAGVYGGIKRRGFSQVQRALTELGAKVIFAYSPEAKGRIERLFFTLQDRLVPELRLNGVKTMSQANLYLQKIFLPRLYKPKFEIPPADPVSSYRPLAAGVDLDEVFCLKELRTVSRDHTISLDAERYQIAGVLKHSIHKQKIEIRTYLDGTWQAFFAGRRISLVRIKDKVAIA